MATVCHAIPVPSLDTGTAPAGESRLQTDKQLRPGHTVQKLRTSPQIGSCPACLKENEFAIRGIAGNLGLT